MKKLISLLLTLTLLLAAAAVPALADEGGSAAWQVISLEGSDAELTEIYNNDNFRVQAFSGPGRDYSLAGAYLPRKISAKALCTEGDFVLLDIEYNGGRRCVYVPARYVASGSAEGITVTPVSARTTAAVDQMFYGPGIQYDQVRQRMRSKYADMTMDELMKIFNKDLTKIRKAVKDVFNLVELPAGTPVSVLYEVNGWVCVETSGTVLGRARTWIPADKVTAE